MKKVRNILISYYIYLISFVMVFVSFIFGSSYELLNKMTLVFGVSCIIAFCTIMAFGIICIIDAIRLFRNEDYNLLRANMKILKYSLIPYFIINFGINAIVFIIFLGASRGLLIFTPIPLLFGALIIFAYISVLFSSSYSVLFILLNLKRKKIKIGKTVLFIWMQLCFVIDVLGVMIMLIKFKKEKSIIGEGDVELL